MKKRRINSEKLNNKGFSLVEVIIAIVIISIVCGAVLSCLVSSTKYAVKAKENQYVTGAAQSILEGVKASTLESLTKQFNDPDHANFKVLKQIINTADSTRFGNFPYSSYAMTPRAVGATPDVPYEFFIYGVDYQNHLYDSKITITPHGTVGDPNYGIQEVTYIENMNGFRDAVYTEDPADLSSGYNAVLDQMVDALNAVSGTYRVDGLGVIRWEGNFTREMLFNSPYKDKYEINRITAVEVNGGSSTQTVSINVKYTFKIKNLPYTDSAGHSKNFTKEDFPDYDLGTTLIYNNSATATAGAKLENVFMFVYPGYESSSTKYRLKKDEYDITNNLSGSEEMNVFWVKQLDNSLSAAALTNCENSYKPTVKCVNKINLYHNAKDNLSNPDGPKMNGAVTNFSATVSSTIIDGLTEKEDHGIHYDVKVEIMNAGETDVIYTLTGSMSDN